MALAFLLDLNPWDERALEVWSIQHARDHDAIRIAIQAQYGKNIAQYQLDPIPVSGLEKWLLDHQQAHNDMNAELGTNGEDLSIIDLKDPQAVQAWSWENFSEHRDARSILKI